MIDQHGSARGASAARSPRDDRRVVALDDVSRGELAEVLEHERQCWARELDWDFSHTSGLIERSLGTHGVAGFALRHARRVVAYAYYVTSPERSHIGSVHALPEAEAAGAATLLVDRSLTHLTRDLPARRVESQFLYFGTEPVDTTFAKHGFKRYERQFLRGPLDCVRPRLERATAATGVQLAPFRLVDLAGVAEIVRQSFVGSVDAEMSECYATAEGCRSFVEGVAVRNGCGSFDADASLVASRDGRLVGVLLASAISADTGHVVQISVLPAEHGRGIGRQLLAAACARMAARSASLISLSVSTANRRPRDWYRSLGFDGVKDFSAWVWRRSP